MRSKWVGGRPNNPALNVVLAKHGIPKPKFKGFMEDNAQANWIAVRVIYKSGDAAILIKD